ncbi:sodium:calcium antiporter [Halegenticoccus tardaugens]|uniref:sodium:calcium antiporter n=1 Tax=Halegenticoccus tardaugens TaxID=2071624 RepID=UPI00100AC49B|nr:sodium:proton exchanger [Halegenticoccus tardaugens]
MVEEMIESFVESQGLWFAFVVLAAGGVILVAFIEKLISYLTRAALGLGVSVFSLAILFTGFEFDDTILALVFASGGLEDAALGTALGTALAIVGITLAVAAAVQPFSVEIPRDYLTLLVLSPLILLPLVLLGNLTAIHGIGLLVLFFAFLAYIVYMEHRRDVPVFRDTDVVERVETDGGVATDSGIEADGGATVHDRIEPILEDEFVRDRAYAGHIWLGLAVAALAGVVFGSILIETGSEIVLEETGVEETVFGATVITVLLTFENVLLTLEPVRRGIPEIGIGHVIGSVVFSVTGNIGFILLLADLNIGASVLYFHFPALLFVTALGAYVIKGREVRRWHGFLLGGLYVAYWVIAVAVFGGVPISG